jgi:Flp pilus assembly pilin Flp
MNTSLQQVEVVYGTVIATVLSLSITSSVQVLVSSISVSWEAVASTADSVEGPEANLSENTNSFISLAAESSPEDTEEGDLSQRVIPVTKPTFECKECDRSFPTKTGLSQHERFKHPNLRNANRIAGQEKDIERKRKARLDSRKLAEETGTTYKPKKSQWTEVEIELLVQLEVELSGARFINNRNHPLTEVALFRVFRTRFSCKAYARIGILRQGRLRPFY